MSAAKVLEQSPRNITRKETGCCKSYLTMVMRRFHSPSAGSVVALRAASDAVATTSFLWAPNQTESWQDPHAATGPHILPLPMLLPGKPPYTTHAHTWRSWSWVITSSCTSPPETRMSATEYAQAPRGLCESVPRLPPRVKCMRGGEHARGAVGALCGCAGWIGTDLGLLHTAVNNEGHRIISHGRRWPIQRTYNVKGFRVGRLMRHVARLLNSTSSACLKTGTAPIRHELLSTTPRHLTGSAGRAVSGTEPLARVVGQPGGFLNVIEQEREHCEAHHSCTADVGLLLPNHLPLRNYLVFPCLPPAA